MTHVQSIFDPSIRHQSIKYYDEPTRNVTRGHSKKSGTSKKKECRPNGSNGLVFGNDTPLTVANVMNGKCTTPVINGESKSQLKVEPSHIYDGPHSPLLRNGLISSSAPSHLNGFNNGLELNGFSNGHLNGAINSEDEEDDKEEESMLANGDSNAQSSQSPPRAVPQKQPIKGKMVPTVVSSKAVAAANSQPKAQPILLVASR